MAAAGDFLFVRYDMLGAALWHHRLVLASVAARPGSYIILTPDSDLYEEDYSGGDADIEDVVVGPSLGAAIAALVGQATYEFDVAPSSADMVRYVGRAHLMLGLPAPSAPVVPRVAPGRGGAPPVAAAVGAGRGVVLPLVAGVAPKAAPAVPKLDPTRVWVISEDGPYFEKGTIVDEPLPPGALVIGDRGLLPRFNSAVHMRHIARSDLSRFLYDDLRVMAVVKDAGRGPAVYVGGGGRGDGRY